MEQKNNTTLVAIIAALATLTIVMLLVIVLVFANKFSGTSSEDASRNIPVVSGQYEPDESSDSYATPTTMYIANVQNAVYLRRGPVENGSNVITTIPVGTQILWLENTNTVFSKISYNGMTGYVKRDYLSINRPQQNTVNSGNTTIYKYMYVANVENSIYLRSTAAETSNNIITTIPVGTQVGFIERTNNVFSKINYNGTIGYAKTAYLADYYNTKQTYLTVCNVKNAIYLRSAPQENPNNIICEIPVGSTVRYLGNASGGFYKISYDGYIGYSKSIYLR